MGSTCREIWRYNAYVLPPTVSFYLEDQPDVIRERLARPPRAVPTGADRLARTRAELYNEAFSFLHRHDWEQVKIDCQGQTPEQIVAAILQQLNKYAE